MAYSEWLGLQIRTVPQGRDFVWLVTGGEAHVGAAAVAYRDEADGRIHSRVLTVPGHRETELAQELAERAAERLGTTVTVVAGIHLEGATREDIVRIVEEVRRLAGEELDLLEKERNPSNHL